MASTNDLTVSLELHLAESLSPLAPILPPALRESLSSELTRSEIRYALLSDISQWSRSEEGAAALIRKNLNPLSYTMSSLLAGARTSPSKRFPKQQIPLSAEEAAQQQWSDRKALTAVVNSILSVICSGGAAWWVADKNGWRDEWKVLLALSVAVVVAFSETILYILWQSRATKHPRYPNGNLKGPPTTRMNEHETVESQAIPVIHARTPRESETGALAPTSEDSPDVQIRRRKAPLDVKEED